MYVFLFCVSPSALSVGEISHASAPASLLRDRALLVFFSVHGFPLPVLLPLFELRCVTKCSIVLPPRLGLFRVFVPLKCIAPSPWVR